MELLLLLLLFFFLSCVVGNRGKVSSHRFGSMVAFFRYSPIDILNVHLPPSVLEFNSTIQHEWIRKEASEVLFKNPGLLTLNCFVGLI